MREFREQYLQENVVHHEMLFYSMQQLRLQHLKAIWIPQLRND
jgi:hypothetical protein